MEITSGMIGVGATVAGVAFTIAGAAVFWKYTGMWFGKRLSWYRGLHQDHHVSPPSAPSGFRSDLMCWLEPPITASWIKEI